MRLIKSLFKSQHTQEFTVLHRCLHDMATMSPLKSCEVLKGNTIFCRRPWQLIPSQCPLEVDGILTRHRTCCHAHLSTCDFLPFTMVSQTASSKSPKCFEQKPKVRCHRAFCHIESSINSTAYLFVIQDTSSQIFSCRTTKQRR